MTGEILKILLVDDAVIDDTISDALNSIGVKHEIDFRRPVKRTVPFGCELPSGRELETFDLALIDLELFPLLGEPTYKREDLRGGTEVLPYLRREAPWLPVIAESRLFKAEAKHLLIIACGFGFDGHIPQTDFSSEQTFTRLLWDNLLKSARELREKAILGEDVFLIKRQPEVDIDEADKNVLDDKLPGWHEIAQNTFCFASKIVITPLFSGFSGAKVFKVYAIQQHPEDSSSEGEWVWKISASPWKLHNEVRAHSNMLRSGLDHARMVPLLWNSVIVKNRLGSIAYKFAENTTSATKELKELASTIKLCKRLAPMFSRLYKNKHNDRSNARRLITEWFSENSLKSVLEKLEGESDVARFIRSIVGSSEDAILNISLAYQRCRIHGDLHFGNIMLGSENKTPDLLIDFANSKIGPITIDFAKLISDILIRVPESRCNLLTIWENTLEPLNQIMKQLDKVFKLNIDDRKLFGWYLILFLGEALSYEDITPDTKSWIINLLNKEKISAL